MTFEAYQSLSRKTAHYPDPGKNIVYPTLGLASEAGEVAGKIKKVIRDNGGIVDAERKEQIKQELGDVLWYVAQLATELGLSCEEIAEANLEKLAAREKNGTLSGSGDNR